MNWNPLKDLTNAVTSGARSVGRAVEGAAKEAVELVTESINDVSKATEEGGFVGGTAQFLEEVSPGNFVAGAVDVLTGDGRLDPNTAQQIRFATNVLVGGPAAGITNLRDGMDMLGKLMAPQEQKAPPPAGPVPPGQSAEPPATGFVRLIDRDLRITIDGPTKERLKGIKLPEKAWPESPDIGGYVKGPKPGKTIDRQKDAIEQANAELDKLLNNPNLSFEDMIFLVMQHFMKEQQDEVRQMTTDLGGKKDAFEKEKVGLNANVDAAKKEFATAQAAASKNPGDEKAQTALADAAAKVRGAEERLNTASTDFGDSRAMQFELLKNAMNKLSEMQSTISNILNAMHQTAMQTIGNIR